MNQKPQEYITPYQLKLPLEIGNLIETKDERKREQRVSETKQQIPELLEYHRKKALELKEKEKDSNS